MTREEVVRKREELEEELGDAIGQVDVIQAKLRALTRKCKHPGLRKYSAMGEVGNYCDDCHFQD